MKRLLISGILLLACFISCLGVSIRGNVRAENDSIALAGATCALIEDGNIIADGTTNEDGTFQISTNTATALVCIISMDGFKPSEVIIESGKKDIDLGIIYLSNTITLNEVNITASSVLEGKGKTIIFPSQSEVKASSSAISLFQKLPLSGLEANPINRSLMVDGGLPVILINGVPSTINEFNGLQAKDIAKIEYSRITPPRYSDKGKSGFINITLKQRRDGGNVYLWGRSAVNTVSVDGNAHVSYHQGASRLTLDYAPSWRNYKDVYDIVEESYIGDNFRVDMETQDRNPFCYHYHDIRLKYEFTPDLQTLFSATLGIVPNFDRRETFGNSKDSQSGDYETNNFTESNDFTPSLDLFFKKRFNESNTLELQIVGTFNSGTYRKENHYAFADGSVKEYSMNVDTRRKSLISEIYFSHDFSNNLSLACGFQNTLSRNINTYLTSDYKPILTENNNYLYASFSAQAGNVYFQLNTGAKLYWIKNDLNNRHFFRNLTSARISWKISNMFNIQGVFIYTPVIPTLTDLTDHPTQLTPYVVSNGNPELKVSEQFNYQLLPSFQYKKFQAFLRMSYRRTNAFTTGEIRYLGNHLFLEHVINSRYSWNANADLTLTINDIAGFGANLNLGLRHYEVVGESFSHHLTSFNANVSLWWNHGPFTISYYRKFPGKYLGGRYVIRPENGDALSFRYNPDKHWNFEVSWAFMFTKKGATYPMWCVSPNNPSYTDRWIKNNSNMVAISISYSTDFGTIFNTSERNLHNKDSGGSLLKM